MTETTIYHNPRCSKSRETLRLLNEAGVNPTIIEYLNTPPTAEELDRILGLLNLEPAAIVRQGEQAYRALGIDAEQMTREALIQILVENPILIERPIVVKGDSAVIGRPPENALSLV